MALRDVYIGLETDLSNADEDWVHYVKDHYKLIVASGGWLSLDKFRHNTMKYRLEDFLKDESIDPSISWIILMINQLGSNVDFANLERLLIPDLKFIQHLREQYVSLRANFREAREK